MPQLEVEIPDNGDSKEESSVEAEKDLRRLSISVAKKNKKEINNINDDNDNDFTTLKTVTPLVKTRAKRTKTKINYNEESSDDDIESSDEENINPLFEGLTKEQIKKFEKNNNLVQNEYKENLKNERVKKINDIKNAFKFNIDQDITDEEASFSLDYCKKYQHDIYQKIEEEGYFFLERMREMMEEKKLQLMNTAAIKERIKKKKKNKNKNNNNNDSEYSESSYSDYSYNDDSDFGFDEDDENLISEMDEDDDEDWILNSNKKKRKRYYKKKLNGENKKGYNNDGKERCGRLLLDDALQDTANKEGWSVARIKAFEQKKERPNAYYYRFNKVGQKQKNGKFAEKDEIESYMERVYEYGVNFNWGLFSVTLHGRVGYQCSNFWRQLVKERKVWDPNYTIGSDGKLTFKRKQNNGKTISDGFRRYSFIVKKPLPGPFNVGDRHPKCPKNIKKLLKLVGIKTFDGDDGIISDDDDNDNDNNNNNEEDEDEDVDMENDKKNKKKKKKSKKKNKKSKKKKNKKNKDDNNDENSDKKSKKKKKKSKKNKKNKNSDDTDNKSDKKPKKNSKKRKKKDEKENKEIKDELSSEPPKKKRRTSSDEDNNENRITKQKKEIKKNKNKKISKKEETDKKEEQKKINECILGEFIDIITGKQIIKPAISPFGHVLGYDTWCKILRNAKTKELCPFTRKRVTRRQLIKLDEDNIDEYKNRIKNVTKKDIK